MTRASEEALYLTDPLGSVPPAQIRLEILAAGAPPQMTKDGPKPPTKKMIAAAAARKESFLRAALDARRTRDAPIDWLVAPVCLGVLRRESSSPEHMRLAVEIIREATAIAPEDESVLAETVRLGLAPRGVAAAAFGAGPAAAPGSAISGGSSSRTTSTLHVLAACPPRVGAIVLWRERERITKLVAGEGANANAADAASRAAAVIAVGALLSRADAVEAVARYAPAHADATGARGDGARFLINLWRKVALLAEDGAAPDAAVAAAVNALALLLGPALADAHPAAARVLAAHARDPALHGEYSGSPFLLGGEKDASLAELVYGSSASTNGARWVDDGWARAAARGDGVVARGPATSAGGDDPSGAASSILAAIRLDLTMRVVARARNLAARGAMLSPGERPIAAGALVAALCAALEHGARAGDGASASAAKKGTEGTSPKRAGGGGRGVLVPSALSRLRDAARARAFDDPGGVVALVADSEAARKDLTRLASAGAEYAGEALLRTMASVAAGAGPRADARACLSAGAGLLALSGSLAADAQPLDWVPMGTGALLAAVACDVVPEINGDEAAAAAKAAALDAAVARAEGAKGKRRDEKRRAHSGASSSTGPGGGRSGAHAAPEYGMVNPFDVALTELDDEPDEEEKRGGDSRSGAGEEKTKKPAIREAARVPRRAGDAVAPLSRAAFMLAVADSLPSMPISQPLRAIRALVLESKRGLPSRRDVRVAVVARALAAHAALRTHPEAIVVMTPLGEIIGSLLEDDRAARLIAERKRAAAERAAHAAGIELDMDDLSASTIVELATLKSAKKRAEAAEARRVAAALRADAAAADAAAAAPQFREELCVCAVEAVLRARPESGTAAAFKHESERGAEKRAGWCQVALEAAATLRRAALWPPAATGGRRAASDAATRLIAHLCAATRALVAEGVRVEAPGVHLAAQRVLAALLQETALAQKEGAADDAAAACVAWLACAHLDFPEAKRQELDDDDGVGGRSGLMLADAPGEDEALALELSSARERADQSAKQGGPHGPLVVAMVESLVRGGAARFARRLRAAAAQREAGSMFFIASKPDDAANFSEARHASPESVAAAGVACVEVLGERCPALAERLAGVLDAALSEGSLEDAGPATTARARKLAARMRAVAACARGETETEKAATPVPSLAADPQTRAALAPPPILLAHLGTREGAVSGRRWVAGDTRVSRREAATAAAAAAADFAVLAAARDAVEAATRLVAAAARRDGKDGDDASQTPYTDLILSLSSSSPSSLAAPTPLTGPSDPCWIEASHVLRRDARAVRVSLRCRPPPPSNESGAAGSAGLAGTLQVGTHGPLAFADGATGVTVELSGAAAREKAAAAARDVVGVPGVGGDGGGAFASMAGNAGHVGHVVSRRGVGADEETLVTVEVRVRAFERVALRPIVTFAFPSGGMSAGGGVPGVAPADGAPAATLRCVAYRIPLADLLAPDDATRGDPERWERLWALLPASFEVAARVDRHAAKAEGHAVPDQQTKAIRALDAPDGQRAALAAAAAALGGVADADSARKNKRHPKKKSLETREDGSFGVSRDSSFARCGSLALGSAGASCERFAATTWDGEHILVAVFASGEGVRLEHRARSAATLAPIAADKEAWLAEISRGVLVVADAAADAAGDASLFRPPVELAPETLARGPEQGEGVNLHNAAAGEWKAMAVA